MASTCKSCRWWGDSTGKGGGYGEHDKTLRFCTRAFHFGKEYPWQPDDDLCYVDDPDAIPSVGPYFGCIHHEEKT